MDTLSTGAAARVAVDAFYDGRGTADNVADVEMLRLMVSVGLERLHEAGAREALQAKRISTLVDELRDLRREVARLRADAA